MKTFGYEGVGENNKKALIDETFSDLLIHTPQIPIQIPFKKFSIFKQY